MSSTENYMTYNGYKIWYALHDKERTGTPLIVVHGGPGFPHNAQNNCASLSSNGYPVVLYDQLGCGLSDKPDDVTLWKVGYFIEELEALRRHLGYRTINLMGQSWGGSLVLEYALKYPKNVDKLILHSPLIDTKLWVEEADKLKDLLPDGLGVRMRELEISGQTDGDEYSKLSTIFNDYFVCRVKPEPQDLVDCQVGAGLQVYNTMWGPSEAHATGNMKDWSIISRLKDIQQKTLLISGKYDEATPKQMQVIADSIPDITWELFENSSHCANLEEPDKFMATATRFLA